jgi:hypothetical protein
MDRAGTTTNWNIGAASLFGFTESEMIGSADGSSSPDDRQKGDPDQERSLAP